MTAVAVLTLAAAAMYLPSRIDTARANRRRRQADAAHWNARIQRALEAGPLDEPDAAGDLTYQQMCFERWQQQMDGAS